MDWDPDDPRQMAEEARSWSEDGARLYFDYLGFNGHRAPTLLVEAKGADAEVARQAYAAGLTARAMAMLISEALGKPAAAPSGILAEWAKWLKDLRTYVRSLGDIQRGTLRRVAITAGRWLIVFTNPIAAFVDDDAPPPETIHCYVSLEEIVERHAEIYRLLARPRLANTLPLTLTLREALVVLKPSALATSYRGVVVATRASGAGRKEYPTRSIYPAVVLLTGGLVFAIVDYNDHPLEEPRDAAQLDDFLAGLAEKGDAFERNVMRNLGRADLAASPLELYPTGIREAAADDVFAPFQDSTADMEDAALLLRPQLVRRTGERNAEHEYLVITGQAWFYKAATPFGTACEFHSFPSARREGVAGAIGHFDRVANAFTVSADPQHCEHDALSGLRAGRCQLAVIENQLCCRACVYHPVCWRDVDLPRLPCPV